MEITFLRDTVNSEVKTMEHLQDIVNRITEDATEGDANFADMMSEIVVIDVDEIIDNFGTSFVYQDLIGSKGVGSLSFIYSRLVHPIITSAFNSAITDDEEAMKKHLRQLASLRENDDLGNFVHDGLEQRIWELVQTSGDLLHIRTKDLLRLCVAIAEIVLVRIRDFAIDFSNKLPKQEGIRAGIQIDQRCAAEVVPARNPDSLVITLTYGWVYI